jgi:predicted TIM-barrel fold metal-dependent hydrolase
MTFPQKQPVIDLMMAIPGEALAAGYRAIRPLLMDAESLKAMDMPAHYLFKDLPKIGPQENYGDFVVAQMDRFNIRRALIGLEESIVGDDVRRRYGERFLFETPVNPHLGMEEVRRIRRLHRDYKLSAVSVFAAGLVPQVPINDKKLYPIYAVCAELQLPVFVNVGVPGPRVPGAVQHVELLDEVCWFFPELTVVMRHGAEPWEALAVKLMLKWPNLYYSTSAFAPKHYPQAIIDYANSRGADKVLYAGYFPMGLSLDRIFAEFPQVPFKAEVWPKFLHDNAARLFRLGA